MSQGTFRAQAAAEFKSGQLQASAPEFETVEKNGSNQGVRQRLLGYDDRLTSVAEAAGTAGMEAIFGAVLVLILVMAIISFIAPSGTIIYKYVFSVSMSEVNASPTLTALRRSVEIQTVLFIAGVIIAGMFAYMFKSRLMMYGIIVASFLFTVMLMMLRSFAHTALNVFFFLLAFYYLITGAFAGYIAYKAFKQNAKLLATLVIAMTLVYIIAAIGAFTSGYYVKTGVAAQELIELMDEQGTADMTQ